MVVATDGFEKPAGEGSPHFGAAARHVGTVVANSYRIVRHIGSGGSSHVFEAEHVRLGKPFAIKVLKPEIQGRKAAQRFCREARAIARLQSEHIVSVIDCGVLEDDTPYLVMELLQGEDLRCLLRREHVLAPRRAAQIVIEACRGLSEVHEAGLVHRDLKPENLFIARRATGEDWCKVLDFGVVKMETTESTARGSIVGTVRYMAPEQLADVASVAPATDVYALGAILYECLCGEPLHGGDTVQEVMYQVMNVPAVGLATLRPELPPALVAVVERALEKPAQQRLQSVAALAELLSEVLSLNSEGLAAFDTLPEDGTPPRPLARSRGAPPPPHTGLRVSLAALVGVAAGVVIAGSIPRSDAAPELPAANHVVAQASVVAPLPSGTSPSTHPTSPPARVEAVSIMTAPARPEKVAGGSTPQRARTLPTASVSAFRQEPLHRFDDANPYGAK
jgi:serine/threonine protein kinase